MKKFLKKAVIIFAANWLVFFCIFMIMESGDMGVTEILSGCTTFAVLFSLMIMLPLLGFGTEPNPTGTIKTNLLSCHKCGYLGVGSGICPKCGWSYTTKITSDTTMISCPDCGYLGAGYGNNCPKCNHTRAQKINSKRY